MITPVYPVGGFSFFESIFSYTDRVRCGIRESASPRRAPVLSASRFRDSWFVVREGVGLRADEFLVFMGGFAQAGMMPVIADGVLPASGELPQGEGGCDPLAWKLPGKNPCVT